MEFGITHFELPQLHPKAAVDATHERFGIDHNRCILCTRCVRVCDEVEGAHTWDVMGRGTKARIITDLGTPGASPPPARAAASASRCARPAPSSRRADRWVRPGAAGPTFPTWWRGRVVHDDRKPRLATIWLDGCSGCHMSLLDMDERLLEITERADLVFGALVDFKEFPENVDVTLVEGAVSSEDDLRKILEVRRNTRILVSLGDCAVTSNVPGMRNPIGPGPILERAYLENVTLHAAAARSAWCRGCCRSPVPCTRWSRWTSSSPDARPRRT